MLRLTHGFEILRLTPVFETLRLTCDFKTRRQTLYFKIMHEMQRFEIRCHAHYFKIMHQMLFSVTIRYRLCRCSYHKVLQPMSLIVSVFSVVLLACIEYFSPSSSLVSDFSGSESALYHSQFSGDVNRSALHDSWTDSPISLTSASPAWTETHSNYY